MKPESTHQKLLAGMQPAREKLMEAASPRMIVSRHGLKSE